MPEIILEIERPTVFGFRRKPEQKHVEIKEGETIYDLLKRNALPTKDLNISINGEPVSSIDMTVPNGAMMRFGNGPAKAEPRPQRISYAVRATGS